MIEIRGVRKRFIEIGKFSDDDEETRRLVSVLMEVRFEEGID